MVLLTKVLWMLRSEDWIIKKESDYNKQVSHRKLSRLVTPLWGGEELFLLRRRPNFYLEFEIDPTSGLLLGVDHKPRPYRRSQKDVPYPSGKYQQWSGECSVYAALARRVDAPRFSARTA